MRYELVVVWYDGTKECHSYGSEIEARKGKANMEKAFGSQVWCCVREVRG